MKAPWYEITAKEDHADIMIYEQIGTDQWTGEGISAKTFIQDLNALKVPTINLNINSPGGNVFDGNAIYNALKAHKAKKHVKIDGLAASIASVIAMAGDTIEMPENAMLMIHNASGLVYGNAGDMHQMADALGKVDDGMVSTYHSRSKLDRKRIADLMADETWITAKEAVEYGMADTITERVEIQACASDNIMARFKNLPAQFNPTGQAPVHNSEENRNMEEITLAYLIANHAELVADIKADGSKDGFEKGRIDGSTSERNRIQAVEAQCIPGHEKLIEALKFDGKTTGEQAAVKVLQAEKGLRANVSAQLAADAPPAVPHVAATDTTETSDDPETQWKNDPKLRAEFGEFEIYAAYMDATNRGLVRVLKTREV